MFADEELESLRGFPEIGRDELFGFFTLTPADVAFVDPGWGPADRLGLAVALCTLPWVGTGHIMHQRRGSRVPEESLEILGDRGLLRERREAMASESVQLTRDEALALIRDR
ncbi:MAG: DUF4158 domain-containing protein [Pseudonocardia sp.]